MCTRKKPWKRLELYWKSVVNSLQLINILGFIFLIYKWRELNLMVF